MNILRLVICGSVPGRGSGASSHGLSGGVGSKSLFSGLLVKKRGDGAHTQLLNPRRVGFQMQDKNDDGWKWGHKRRDILISLVQGRTSRTFIGTAFLMVWWFQSQGLVDVFSFDVRKKRLGKSRPT